MLVRFKFKLSLRFKLRLGLRVKFKFWLRLGYKIIQVELQVEVGKRMNFKFWFNSRLRLGCKMNFYFMFRNKFKNRGFIFMKWCTRAISFLLTDIFVTPLWIFTCLCYSGAVMSLLIITFFFLQGYFWNTPKILVSSTLGLAAISSL